MALILEIRDRRGTTSFHLLNGEAVTLGRALSSDIILDDPYVDARHARIAPDDTGTLTLRDLGSVNGVLANGVRTSSSVPVQPGTELKIGRTTLRFRDRDEPVPPAFVESSYRLPHIARWALTLPGSLFVMGLLIGVTAFNTWLSSTERSSGSSVLAGVLAVWAIVGVWSAIWAAVVRGPDRRFHGRAHLVVAAAVSLMMILYTTVNDWLLFLFPDLLLVNMFSSAVLLLGIALVIVGHLSVAGVATPRLRWRVGLGVSAGLLALTLIGVAVRDDAFSDVPRFPGQLKPISPRLVPTRTVEQFVEAIAEARKEADSALDKGAR